VPDRFCPLGYLMFASCVSALVWVCAVLKALPAP
jgi:hypothetical protein